MSADDINDTLEGPDDDLNEVDDDLNDVDDDLNEMHDDDDDLDDVDDANEIDDDANETTTTVDNSPLINGSTMTGTAGQDTRVGTALNDIIYGNKGADSLFDNDGSDVLFGCQGEDSLDGGAGADFLYGNLGNDVIAGGAGADRFNFGTLSDADVVNDFSVADGDVLGIAATRKSGAISSVQDIIGAATADGIGNTVIDLGDGNEVTLIGVDPSALSAANVSLF